ncbi:MAG: DAK2 domain-containing protein [Bacilli bacterium]
MKSINADLLKLMFVSASNNLYNHYPEIDALNVFPVPDGDTGMNMNLTLSSGAKEIQNRTDNNVYDLAKTFAKGLLMGARGNSGVITSQIFRGFANALEGKTVIKVSDLAACFDNARLVAYKAVIKPVEGTILTVCRESAESLNDKIDSISTIEEAFAFLIKEAKASLEHTPELLPILKEAGLVDSGGAGYLTILEGMNAALKGKLIEKSLATALEDSKPITGPTTVGDEDEEFGYCTELIMSLGPDTVKKPFNESRYKSSLSAHGCSLALVLDEDIVKVHIHTLNPGWVLSYSQQFGEFLKLKIENMTEQHSALVEAEKAKIVASKKVEEPLKEYALIACSYGEGINAMFKEIGVDEVVSGGQTMNPSTEDFVKAINKVHAKNVYILPNNSNIVMAASQAVDVVDEKINVQVVASSTIPQGLVSAMMFNPDVDPKNNLKEMKAALKTVKSASITYAIKETEIDGVKVKKDDYIALVDKKIIACVPSKIDALTFALEKMVSDNSSIITIFLGEDVAVEEKDKITEILNEKYDYLDLDIRNGNQPVYSFIIGVE